MPLEAYAHWLVPLKCSGASGHLVTGNVASATADIAQVPYSEDVAPGLQIRSEGNRQAPSPQSLRRATGDCRLRSRARNEVLMIATTNSELITVPQAATRMGIPLDRLRARVRLAETRLVALGLVVRAGRHRLVQADQLEELRKAMEGK